MSATSARPDHDDTGVGHADTTAADQERPGLWFSLPPGYYPLGDDVPDGLAEQLTEGLPPEAAEAIERSVEGARTMLRAQQHSPLSFHAAGMHPREDGGQDLSQLSAGTVAITAGPPDAVLVRVAEAEEARAETTSVRVEDFPAGHAVVAERSVTENDVEMRGIRVSFAHPSGAHLAVIDLASNAIEQWDAYTAVMTGILAPSVHLEDPALAAADQEARDAGVRRLSDRLGERGEQPGQEDVDG